MKGSADKVFHGNQTLYNPEDMLLSALSSCHMMSYLYLCRKAGIKVTSYSDKPEGKLILNMDGSGAFTEVVLKPVVILKDKNQQYIANLHAEAGKLCFIANSCTFDIIYEP